MKTVDPGGCLPLPRGYIDVYDHHFQRSFSLKPLGQSKPNFMWSLLENRRDVPVGAPLDLSTIEWHELPKYNGVQISQLIYLGKGGRKFIKIVQVT